MSHRARSRYTPPDAERRIQPREASTIMGISPSTVLRLCRSGDLPSARIASRIVIRVGDIYDYLERQKLYGATCDELLATVKPIRPVRRGRSGAANPSGADRLPITIRSHRPASKSAHTRA
jgi:hypothetical protein